MGFLAEEPQSGYDLKTRCFAEQARAFWTADQAQIYRTLDRLQTGGMVTCARQRQFGKPDRKVYRLTRSGTVALAAWIATPAPQSPPRDSFLLQMFFSAALDDGEIVAHLTARRSAHQARLEELRGQISLPSEHSSLPERTRLLRDATLDGAIARERASIDWLDDTIEAIESGQLPAGDAPATADDHASTGTA
jgi:DNA-binding PadR family transcriptional regulator